MIDKLIFKKKKKQIDNNIVSNEVTDKKFVCVEYSHNIQHWLRKTFDDMGTKLELLIVDGIFLISKMFINLIFLGHVKSFAFSTNMKYFQTIINATHDIIFVNELLGKRRFLLMCSWVGVMYLESHRKRSTSLSMI